MQQKDQYIYLDGRFVKISGGKADVRIVSELPADPVEGTIYLIEDRSGSEEFLDITDGITEEIREAVRNRPEQLLRYSDRLYSPVFKSSDEEIPTYYASVQTDEKIAYGLQINWDSLEIVEEYEVPMKIADVKVNGESVVDEDGVAEINVPKLYKHIITLWRDEIYTKFTIYNSISWYMTLDQVKDYIKNTLCIIDDENGNPDNFIGYISYTPVDGGKFYIYGRANSATNQNEYIDHVYYASGINRVEIQDDFMQVL